MSAAGERLLRLEGLGVALARGGARPVPVLDGLDLAIDAGEMVALVGESGSSKTIAALAITRLLPPGAVTTGRVLLEGQDLLTLSEAEMRGVRGGRVGMVFQDPLAALNPSHTVGRQIVETYRLHTGAGARAARARAIELLAEVGIDEPARRVDEFPHQFSGGMRQRAMIAIALACNPRLLIADEPTTGLDPIIARQILSLLARLRQSHTMGVLFVTHDLSIVEEHADRVHVLYAGRSVEEGPAASFFAEPHHPYSRALLASSPRLGQARLREIAGSLPEPEARPAGCRFAPRCPRVQPDCLPAPPPLRPVGATRAACLHPESGPPVPPELIGVARGALATPGFLTVDRVSVRYAGAGLLGRKPPPSLAEASFVLRRGECLGVVGASGSGKTTLGRAVLQMLPYSGSMVLDGQALGSLRGAARRAARRRLQVVFQDPKESLNPTLRVAELVGEPLVLAGMRDRGARRERAAALLERVGLPAAMLDRLPGTLSGGQAQRVAIARALAAEPELIVLDEPTSALDVSTQAVLLNLLRDLADERGIAYLLISHDLAAVSYLAHRIAVVLQGRIVELADSASLIAEPRHPYTVSLVSAAPRLDARPAPRLAVG
jgi:peptide/nickel transport system ATP-binding protein